MVRPSTLPAHAAAADSGAGRDLDAALAQNALAPHFQPIVRLDDGSVYGHEALIRIAPGWPWRNPDELFHAARDQGRATALEFECVRLALRAWGEAGAPGRLFLNLSAAALVAAMDGLDVDSLLAVSRSITIAPQSLVVELTEHERVLDVDALAAAVAKLRQHRAAIALDDFGDGRSSLRLWSELKPEIVKIDKYFTHDLPTHPEKLQTLRALLQISQTLGSSLVAEGIETTEELHLVRDLGIRYGQGWVLGRPAGRPVAEPLAEAVQTIRSRDIAVFPERRRVAQQRATVRSLLREVPPVLASLTNHQLFERFSSEDTLAAVAIVDAAARPLGLVSRQRFVDRYAKPFFPELYGRKPCTMFANLAPRIVDLHAGIDDLTEVLVSEDQRYLGEGIVITEGGAYRGLASGEDLVRTVTESRVEAARHANPLSLLPGNIPITQHIDRLLRSGRDFVACYGDLNHFKPFNDIYGYWRGDEMILLAARALMAQADPRRDFVGHVGGDDFVVLFQSDDWEARCLAGIDAFNLGALALYDDEARAARGVSAEDRHGVVRFHPLTTLSIGAVRIAPHETMRPEDVASAAAQAKRHAKAHSLGLFLLDTPRAA